MALVTAVQAVPQVLLGALTGAVADRVHRGRLMILCNALQAMLILPLLYVKSGRDIPIVFMIAFGLALLRAQESVARRPMIATLLPHHFVMKGNALFNTMDSIVTMVGPAVSSLTALVECRRIAGVPNSGRRSATSPLLSGNDPLPVHILAGRETPFSTLRRPFFRCPSDCSLIAIKSIAGPSPH